MLPVSNHIWLLIRINSILSITPAQDGYFLITYMLLISFARDDIRVTDHAFM